MEDFLFAHLLLQLTLPVTTDISSSELLCGLNAFTDGLLLVGRPDFKGLMPTAIVRAGKYKGVFFHISPHSRILNQINQSTFSVNPIMMAQAHKISVSAITRPRNLPTFVQTSVIFINPFETCKISDANMTTIAMMNWAERHQTG